MSALEPELADPPSTERERELWLQHAAGFVLFRDVRGYAINRIDPALSPECRAAALKGINDALYGLMMVIDGVPRDLQNPDISVRLKFAVQLLRSSAEPGSDPVVELDLFHGDGMCMGYHGWLGGDFGEAPLIKSGERGKS
jgi:hypothetical protein